MIRVFPGRRNVVAALVCIFCSTIVSSAAGAEPESAQRCPNPDGNVCAGALVPGRSYATRTFRPTLTYSVPTRGWRNFEDWPESFLLVPPRNTLAGVDAEKSDFIGVWTSIAAAHFKAPPKCDYGPVPGVAHTPAAIARWIRKQPELRVSGPTSAAIGGLRGLRVDVRARKGATLPTVTCGDIGGQSFTIFLLFTDFSPSPGAQGLVAGNTMRIYLLRYRGGTLAVWLNDIDSAPGSLRSLEAVTNRFRFSQ